jgi:hypothetical protein
LALSDEDRIQTTTAVVNETGFGLMPGIPSLSVALETKFRLTTETGEKRALRTNEFHFSLAESVEQDPSSAMFAFSVCELTRGFYRGAGERESIPIRALLAFLQEPLCRFHPTQIGGKAEGIHAIVKTILTTSLSRSDLSDQNHL